jgi:hypothetical protein
LASRHLSDAFDQLAALSRPVGDDQALDRVYVLANRALRLVGQRLPDALRGGDAAQANALGERGTAIGKRMAAATNRYGLHSCANPPELASAAE